MIRSIRQILANCTVCLESQTSLMHTPDAIFVARDCTPQEEDVEKACERCGAAKAVHSVVFQVRVLVQASSNAALPVT